jgi:excisionase family DNA binding protein
MAGADLPQVSESRVPLRDLTGRVGPLLLLVRVIPPHHLLLRVSVPRKVCSALREQSGGPVEDQHVVGVPVSRSDDDPGPCCSILKVRAEAWPEVGHKPGFVHTAVAFFPYRYYASTVKPELEEHYPLRKAAEILGVHPITLRRWEKEGKIRCVRTPSVQRRFPRSEILRLLGENLPSGNRAVIYARVSSAKQAGAGNLGR